jgi:hypothetical protein
VTPLPEPVEERGSPILSPVIRALRFAGEEVQLGLVLAAVCQEPTVAAAFADAVIERARYGNPRARRRARRGHEGVYCLGEQQLNARVTRRPVVLVREMSGESISSSWHQTTGSSPSS